MITPWTYAKDTEHSHQAALFMWAGVAERYGFAIANNEAMWPALAAMGGKPAPVHLSNPVSELRWLHAIPNGGLRGKATAASLKAEGVKSGVCDVFWPLNRVWGGTKGDIYDCAGLYIEMKRPGKIKDVSQQQKEFIKFAIDNKYCAMVCDNWFDAAKIIQQYYEGGCSINE